MTEAINLPEIQLGSPGEEISRKDLHAISQRFKNLHLFKIQRIQQFLRVRQHVFLDLLALIFHQNHPLLPGFISSDTPFGIPDFTPGRATLKAATIYTRSFRYKRRAAKSHAIEGLYLMGSVSSIAFTKSSDIDIWLCHDPSLSSEALQKLQDKATAVETWAASIGLEVHFFLINSEQFRNGQDTPISTESSGKTQHYLLLEEFYRTAIYVAGKIPAWWLVPPHEEHNYPDYVQHLLKKRFVTEHEIIDFGGLNAVPVEEFVSATLWHIYKAIYSPHKSILKLMLMESYVSEYPNPKWLAQELKQAIYSGQFLIDDLDPYLLMYRKLESYLQKSGNNERINLLRKCLYLKIIGENGSSSDLQTKQLREVFLQDISQRWQWQEFDINDLGRSDSWAFANALQEHQTIVKELTQCYRMNIGFAKKHLKSDYVHDRDSRLIGRKLFAFLEKKPDKVEIISTRSIIQAAEDELSIIEIPLQSGSMGWGVFLGKSREENPVFSNAMKTSWNLVEILLWMVVNGLYHKKIKIRVQAASLHLNATEIHLTLNEIQQFLDRYLDIENKSLETYKRRKKEVASLLIINLGILLPEARDDGSVVISERSDALSYGMARKNFIQTLDRILITSWGEIFFSQDKAAEGLFNCFVDTINKSREAGAAPPMEIACFTQLRAKSIVLRIKTIYHSLQHFFGNDATNSAGRYILPVGQSYYLFQKFNGAINFFKIDSESQILDELANAQQVFSSVFFDSTVLENTPIPYLYTLNKSNAIQVFTRTIADGVDLYIIDEKGSLFFQRHQQATARQLFSAYSVFLETIVNKYNFENDLKIEYWEVLSNSKGILSSTRVAVEQGITQDFLNIRVSAIENIQKNISYTVYCNELEFSSATFGKSVFKAAGEYVIQLRKSKEQYPIHITDIDVPWQILGFDSADEFQTIRFLQFKDKIERRINLDFL